MKPTTINVQITKCPKQYEAVRLGLEASLEPGESPEGAIKAATAQLNQIYTEMYSNGAKVAENGGKEAKTASKPEEAEPAKKELLTFGDARVQAIVKKIEREPGRAEEILQSTRKYFDLDEQAEKTIMLAVKLNKN